VRLYGMASTDAGGGNTDVSAGWFYYNSQLVRFPAQTYAAPAGGNAIYVVVTATATPLTFNDASTPNVIKDVTGVLTELVNTTATDATHFLLSALAPWGREGAFTTIAVATAPIDGSVSGDILYKKNLLNNTLHIKGTLTASAPGNFGAAPNTAVFKLMGTLPAGYRPSSDSFFTAQQPNFARVLDDTGNYFIDQINGLIQTNGNIQLLWLKPTGTVGAYVVSFNLVVPLD
jgi:hypothetical protein